MAEWKLEVIADSQRDRVLNRTVAAYAREGWTISAIFAGQAIAQRKRPPFGSVVWVNVVLIVASILLTLITAGLFLIALLVIYLTRETETVIITVDEYGQLTTS